jgi:pimeloyl-ACP methyl ester carboxylesterase
MRPSAAFLKAEAHVFASSSLEPQARELRLDKLKVTVRALEVGTGEPALFLHGFGLTTAHWAPLMARLPSLHSFAIDMPGHGMSDGADYRGWNLRDWYKDLLTGCLDELELDSAHIVGHSQGAMLGMWLALDAAQRVRSLVAIGTPSVAFGAQLDDLKVLARPGIGPLMFAMPKPAFMYRQIMATTMGRHVIKTAPDLVRTTYLATRGADHARTVSTYLREMFAGTGEQAPRYVLSDAELARIVQPVLVIWGNEDPFQPIAEAKARAALIANGRFEVVPGGHEPWLDDLEVCAELIATFLSA